jgi:hypothetical protein
MFNMGAILSVGSPVCAGFGGFGFEEEEVLPAHATAPFDLFDSVSRAAPIVKVIPDLRRF